MSGNVRTRRKKNWRGTREIKTKRGEGDQRHTEFTITLLGCTVIKAKSPLRERGGSRPAQSVLPLPWSSSCHPQKCTDKPSGRGCFYCTQSPIGRKKSAEQAQIVMAPATPNLDGGGLPWMSCCLEPEEVFFFDVLMKILCAFLKTLRYTWTCHPPKLGIKNISLK